MKILVQNYENYRNFLRDYYLEQKSKMTDFTYEKFSINAGITAKNFLKLIIEGQRNLTIERIQKVARAIDMSMNELQYFECLVLFNQAEDQETQQYYYARLQKLKLDFPANNFNEKSKSVMQEWYYPALILFLEGKESRVNLTSLAKMLNVPRIKLKNALDTLLQDEVLLLEDGKYKMASSYMRIKKKESSMLQQKYLQSQLHKSVEIFNDKYLRGGREHAKFYSHTFSLRKKDWLLYNEFVRGFLENLTQESNKENGESIGQINIQFFLHH